MFLLLLSVLLFTTRAFQSGLYLYDGREIRLTVKDHELHTMILMEDVKTSEISQHFAVTYCRNCHAATSAALTILEANMSDVACPAVAQVHITATDNGDLMCFQTISIYRGEDIGFVSLQNQEMGPYKRVAEPECGVKDIIVQGDMSDDAQNE